MAGRNEERKGGRIEGCKDRRKEGGKNDGRMEGR